MKYKNQQSGFTLIETVVAILILSLTVSVLLTLTAGGVFSVRYARNQIVADNLAQEALEYIRNSRDSARQEGISWDTWLTYLNVNANGQRQPAPFSQGCFNATRGCKIDPYTNTYATIAPVMECPSAGCANVTFFRSPGFYGYASSDYNLAVSDPVITTYVRKVTTALDASGDQLTVTVSLTWKNGNMTRSTSQSLLLTDWGQ
jgi:prepilin-type N-terminal cleavage/methylation domain-containing protein